ncbi:hypothetical protein NLG97_g3047 [Lecanicillium saksenae]|uniref:Uncharacterized protein n=1 Tax=Lecanicillium saksenae TaxID=468837 RepID=A0ACC1QZE3_9HYPO|nr:hypothetical protein NLG97_g3047 [Lecanicillium saksenae]
MSSRGRKRSRAPAEDWRADCPFELHIASFPVVRKVKDGRFSKTENGSTTKDKRTTAGDRMEPLFQESPFELTGNFRSHATMDIHYHVEPRTQWSRMTRYNSFVINPGKYTRGEFVFVANDKSIARGTLGEDLNAQVGLCNIWVAKILEIKAVDEHQVYARVCWMYSPNELPGGRRPYHGTNEVIASNHLDVINVLSIVGHAKVSHWIEADDDEVIDGLYWRQAFDCRTTQLSPVDLVCRCRNPANPDEMLIGCTSSDCGQWMHIGCLRQDVLKCVYDQLGTDQPYVLTATTTTTESSFGLQRQSAQAALAGERPSDGGSAHPNTEASELAKNLEDNSMQPTELTALATSQNARHAKYVPKKKVRRQRKSDAKPYLGLFQATLLMNEGPMVWEIKDLRPGFADSMQTWSESVLCLLCGTNVK